MKSNIVVITKNIVIGFFVVVFVMGFFSKSIVNLFLPKVIVESAIDGLVERTLNIEGVIEAEKSFKVRLGGAVIVDECFVKVGDIVEVGKPLFRIDKSYGIKDNGSGLEGLRLQLEAKRIRLGNLKQETYEIDEMNIAAMEHRLVKSKEELMKQQELFTAGVISKQEMESFEADIEEQLFAIAVSGLQLKEKKRNDEANIEELENEIERDEHQILELQKQNEFYGNVDNEGIYYSAANGIVTYLSELQRIIPGDTVLTEIADVSGGDALIYTANINEEDYDFVKSAGEIEIIGESILDSMYLKISSVSKMNNTELFQVDAAIGKQNLEKVNVGQKLTGVIKQRFVLEGHNKVPKAAVINFETYKEGSKGTVYLLEETEGVLGIEYRAKEIEVEILAAGDDYVIVSGLENIEEPKVIVNLSYKINNGAKVFLWQ
jgi:multidrug efflux pump subunit AcrA (membrane-fusion protein)